MGTIIARRVETNVPLSQLVTRDGGIAGLTLVIRIFNGDDLTEFLDFADGVFKSAGHGSPTLALLEIDATNAPGVYGVDGGFDLSAITVPAAAKSLLVRYTITAGGETGDATDTIQFSTESIAFDVWEEILTGNMHNVSRSAGRRLRELSDFGIRDEGKAQAGGALSITLAAGAPALDDVLVGALVAIAGGTGAGQVRVIVAYDGTTKIATVDRAWLVNPDVTSDYVVGLDTASIPAADTFNVIRDAILSDGNPFAGADVAAIAADAAELNDTKITTARADNLDEITAARLAELDAANLPADVDLLLAAALAAAGLPADVTAILARVNFELVRVHRDLALEVGVARVDTPIAVTAGSITKTVGVVGSTVTVTPLT